MELGQAIDVRVDLGHGRLYLRCGMCGWTARQRPRVPLHVLIGYAMEHLERHGIDEIRGETTRNGPETSENRAAMIDSDR